MNVRISLLACILLSSALSTRGQVLGLPVADHAGKIPAGTIDGGAGFGHSSDFDLYGGRIGYAITDDVRCFGDMGFADNDFVGQVGSVVSFPLELPIDLGLRGAVYKGFSEDMDVLGLSAMAMTSMQVYYVGLFVYAGAGINLKLEDKEGEFPDTSSGDETTIDPAATLGFLFPATDNLSLYLEGSYVDPFVVSAGARFLY